MKILSILMTLLVSTSLYAEDLYGPLTQAPGEITVEKDGQTHTYQLGDALNTGSLWGDGQNLSITRNGVSSMCGNHLGTLSAPVTFGIQTESGNRVVIVDPAQVQGRISVFGVCSQDNPSTLTQLQLDIKGDDVSTFTTMSQEEYEAGGVTSEGNDSEQMSFVGM